MERGFQISITRLTSTTWKVIVQDDKKILRSFITREDRIWVDLKFELMHLKEIPDEF